MSSKRDRKSARRPHRGVRLECEVLEARLTPTVADQQFVAQIYHQLLGRAPDAGAAGWVSALDQGTSRTEVVREIESSSEYRTDEIQAAYLDLLGRPADPNGQASFLSLLDNGAPPEQVDAIMAGSVEYFNSRASDNIDNFIDAVYLDATGQTASLATHNRLRNEINQGTSRQQIAYTVFTSDAAHAFLVNQLYNDLLNRDADSQGLSYFVDHLDNGQRQEDVVAELVGSDEYYVLHVSAVGTSDQLFVQQIYRDVLGRAADAGGLNYWVSQLQQGSSPAQVVQAFLDSAEGRQDEVQHAFQEYLGRQATPSELAYFVNVLSTQGWAQLQANVVASNEYFQKQGGTDTLWIQGLTAEALGGQATSAETSLALGELQAGLSLDNIADTLFTGTDYLQQFIQAENEAILGSPVSSQTLTQDEGLLQGLKQPQDTLEPMLFSSSAYADDVLAQQLGTVQLQTSAAFTQATPANAPVSGIKTATLTWGTPGPTSPTSGQSQLQFIGGTLGGTLNSAMPLGWLQFTNQTTLPTRDVSNVTMQLTVSVNGATGPVTVSVPMQLGNTTTTSKNGTGTVTLASAGTSVTIPMADGGERVLTISGFSVGRVSATTATSLTAAAGQTTEVELLGQLAPETLAPGIYLATRAADTTEPGLHQFLILVPQKLAAFPGLTQNLGGGVQGIVLGAHDVNGQLVAQTFAAADVQATQAYLEPTTVFSTFLTAGNLNVAPVNLQPTGQSIDANMLELLAAVKKYSSDESKTPITYPAEDGALNPGQAWTDNSWVESILQYTFGGGAAPASLSGTGIGATNRIPQAYFQ